MKFVAALVVLAAFAVVAAGCGSSKKSGNSSGSSSSASSGSVKVEVGLSKPQRASNVQGAFKVSTLGQSQIAGRRVVLIDDVLTSGATVDACARALLRAKAVQVDVLVFARVVDSHKTPI